MKKLLIALTILAVAAVAHAEILATWTFPVSSLATATADSQNANLDGLLVLERGEGAPATVGGGFRTTGFRNDGISTANTDYFAISMSAAAGYSLSLTGISGAFVGTSTYSATPGVSHQWAYSFDNTAFTLADTAVNRTGNGTSSFDFSGTSALQDVAATDTVYLRYYASGQTTTGGWGFSADGFTVEGSVAAAAVPEPATMSLLGLGALAMVLRRKIRK